jgi:hypothetical protein
MEQNPSSEAHTHSASQEIPHLLWKPIVHYRDHKRPLNYDALYNIPQKAVLFLR